MVNKGLLLSLLLALVLIVNKELSLLMSSASSLGLSNDVKGHVRWLLVIKESFAIVGGYLCDATVGKYNFLLWNGFAAFIGLVTVCVLSFLPVTYPIVSTVMIFLTAMVIHANYVCVIAFVIDQVPFPKKYEAAFTIIFWIRCSFKIVRIVARIIYKRFDHQNTFKILVGTMLVLVVLSMVILLVGKRYSKIIVPPQKKVVLLMVKCIHYARQQALKRDVESRRIHWLDYGRDKYRKKMITDIRRSRALLLLFTLLLAAGSMHFRTENWMELNRKLVCYRVIEGLLVYTDLLPTLFDAIAYPIMYFFIIPFIKNFWMFQRDLQFVTVGLMFLLVFHVYAGVVSVILANERPKFPVAESIHVRIYNNLDCDLSISVPLLGQVDVPSMKSYELKDIKLHDSQVYPYNASCNDKALQPGTLVFNEGQTYGLYLDHDDKLVEFLDNVNKSADYSPVVRTLARLKKGKEYLVEYHCDGGSTEVVEENSRDVLVEGSCEIFVREHALAKYDFLKGGVYVVLILEQEDGFGWAILTVTKPNHLSTFYVLPNYVIYAVAVIFYMCFGLRFIYVEAPMYFKTTFLATWLTTGLYGESIILVFAHTIDFRTGTAKNFMNFVFVFLSLLGFLLCNIYYTYSDSENDVDDYPLDCSDLIRRESITSIVSGRERKPF